MHARYIFIDLVKELAVTDELIKFKRYPSQLFDSSADCWSIDAIQICILGSGLYGVGCRVRTIFLDFKPETQTF